MKNARFNAWLLALGLTAASVSHAAVFVVTNVGDIGAGSLRDAINGVNAACGSGPHTIEFNIAGGGPYTIQPASSLPNLTCSGTVINGYSQPGSSANTDAGAGNNANIQIILNGSSSGGGVGFWLHAPNIEIAGIAIRSFNNGIIITSTAPGAVIRGNYIGTDPGGMTAFGNVTGISMNPVLNVRIGGSAAADRNLITGNGGGIINANGGADLSGLVIRNNQIGGDRGGGTGIGNTGTGIDLFGSTGTTGTVLIENNFVKRNTNGVRVIRNTTVQFNEVNDNSGDGVLVEGDSCTVKSNEIYSNGTSPNGSGVNVNVGGSNATIESNSIYNNARSGIELFGGPATLPNNTIFGNPWTGINNHATQPVSITGTRSYGNGTASGILFNNSNPTNDYSATPPSPPHDGDSTNVSGGAPNYPEITSVTQSGGNTTVSGFLRSDGLSQSYTVELFSNSVSGIRQGEVFEGQVLVVTDANGEGTFTEVLSGLKSHITATATRQLTSETSPYSPAVAATGGAGVTEVTNTNDSGAGSLRAALMFANANCGMGPHTITFNIAGAGPHVIQPLSALLVITCANTVINGYSQPGSAVNTAAAGQSNADIRIRLDGASQGGGDGLSYALGVSGSVRGLSITGFSNAIMAFSSVNVLGNFIGVLPDGVTAAKNNIGVNAGGSGCCAASNVIVGTAAAADTNIISATSSAIFYGSNNGQVINNLLGVDRTGARSAALGSNQGVTAVAGGWNNTNNLQIRGNQFAHLSTVVATQGGSAVFSRNSAVLSNVQRSSSVVLYSEVEINRVIYDAAGSTRIEGNINAQGAGLHRVEVFSNPTVHGPVQTETWMGDIDVSPTGPGLFPFGQTFASAIAQPSVTSTFISAGTTFSPVQLKKPFTLSGTPTPFNGVAGGAAASQILTLTNVAGTPLTLSATPAVVTSGTQFSVSGGTCPGATVPAAGTCTVIISFASPVVVTNTPGGLDITVTSTASNVTNGSIIAETIFRMPLTGTATAAAGPVFSPSATSFTFPATALGLSAATQVLTITNTGTADLNASGAVLTAGDFSRTTTCGAILAQAASCTHTFTFTPTATGARTATLTITTDAPGSPHIINLSGTGVAAGVEPTISFAPSSIPVGGNATLSITIANGNVAAATVNPVTFNYPGGLVNAATPNVSSTCGGTPTAAAGGGTVGFAAAFLIPSGGNCTLSVTVTSLAATNYTVNAAAGAITSDIGSNTLTASATLTVTAAAIAPTVTYAFAPASIVTGAPSTVTITITNGNAVAVSANSFTLTHPLNVVNATPANPASTCPTAAPTATAGASTLDQAAAFTLPPSGTCFFSVDVTSSVPNVYTASVPANTIVTPAGSNVASNLANLTVGLPPATGTLTPATLAFGSISVGGNSAVQSLTLTNTSSTTPLSISAITATGPFSFVAGGTCAVGVPLAVLSTCLIDLRFNPVLAGPASGVATVTTSAGNLTATLGGTGVVALVPNISFSPPFIDFGGVPPTTTSAVVPVTVTNSGTGALSVFGITTSPPFAVQLGMGLPPLAAPPEEAKNAKVVFVCPSGSFSLNPGDSCTLGVRFTPPTTGSFNGAVTIANPGAPLNLSLSGNGGIGKIISAQPGSIDFGNVVINQQSPPQVVNIVGTGFETVTLTGVQVVTGVGATAAEVADFSLSHNCTTLPPAAASGCVATLRFRPGALGPRSADLRITGDFEGGTLLVPLDGNGTASPVPLLGLSVTRFGFGQSPVGTGRALSMILSNTGQLPVTLNAIRPLGDFNVQHNCPTQLPVGGQCSIFPASKPVVPGLRLGSLIIESNAGGSPLVLPLEATGCRLFNVRDGRITTGACLP